MKKRTMALTVLMVVLAGMGIIDAVDLIWKWAMIRENGIYILTFYDGVIQAVIGAAAAAGLGMLLVTWIDDELTNATNDGFSKAWDMVREEMERMKK